MKQPKRKPRPSNENALPLTIGAIALAIILGGILGFGCEPVPGKLKSGPTTMPVVQLDDPREIAAKQHEMVYGALRRYMEASQGNAQDYASWAHTSITVNAALSQAQRRGDKAKIAEYTKSRETMKEIIEELDAVTRRLRLDLSALVLQAAELELSNPGLWLYPYEVK